jgi:acyl-CoA thioesterase
MPPKDLGPYVKYLGMELVSTDGEQGEMLLKIRPQLMNAMGSLHGGAIVSLIDCALYWSVHSTLSPDIILPTNEIKVNFFRPVKAGVVRAKAKILHRGKRTLTGEVEVRDEEGHLLAKGMVSYFIVPKKDP